MFNTITLFINTNADSYILTIRNNGQVIENLTINNNLGTFVNSYNIFSGSLQVTVSPINNNFQESAITKTFCNENECNSLYLNFNFHLK